MFDFLELVNLIEIGDLFYLDDFVYVDDGNGNYVLNVKYDYIKIDLDAVINYIFVVKFYMLFFYDNFIILENLNFGVNLV